ncbi:MAG: cupin domain-containing protein [Lachnospiraceae bacterium]|nr:cupin domain-containing protein [Lachnospiraceae bacterium]
MERQTIRIVKESELTPKTKAVHPPYEYTKYEVTDPAECSQCQVTIYEIPPYKSNYPYHYHIANTEVFYILSGSGILTTPQGEREVYPGDFIICPPDEKSAHKLTNQSGTEVLRYLDFDTCNDPDVIHYPDSKKTGVMVKGQKGAFYSDETKVTYYDGE